MKILINKLLLSGILIVLVACNEEWLEPQPLSFFAPENVFTSEAGFESALVVMRRSLRWEYYGGVNGMVSEISASDLGVVSPRSNNVPRDFIRQLTPSGSGNYRTLEYFDRAYRPIRNANVVISRIDAFEWPDVNAKNRVLGEALFIRSFWYYRLVNQFGDVPFLGAELTEPKLDFFSHSRWAILEKIQQDLEFSVQWLPDNSVPGAISKAAGNYLLTQVYLANSAYNKAIESATRIINGPYSLVNKRFGIHASQEYRNTIWDLHRPENIHHSDNSETILATVDRIDLPDDARTGGLFTMRNYNPQWWGNQVRDSGGRHGTRGIVGDPMYDSLGRGNGFARPTPYYLYEIWTDTNDLRRADGLWVDKHELVYNNPSSVDYGKPINPTYFQNIADTFQLYYAIPHYKTFVPEQIPGRDVQGGNGDWYIYRLAGAYLLRAEAYFWTNELALAAHDINVVRSRAGAADVSPGEVSIDFILAERARELFMEEPRKTELTRIAYMMAKNNINGYSLDNFSEKNYYYDRVIEKNVFYRTEFLFGENRCRIAPFHVLWPIPISAINSNSMGIINQNVGYPGAENNAVPLSSID